jgi:hypothetical protein
VLRDGQEAAVAAVGAPAAGGPQERLA